MKATGRRARVSQFEDDTKRRIYGALRPAGPINFPICPTVYTYLEVDSMAICLSDLIKILTDILPTDI